MDALLERTEDVGFQVDPGWVQVGGADPAAVVDRYADRITHVHVADADVEARNNIRLGKGDLDLAACLEAASRAGVEWYVCEHDDPEDPSESLAHGAEYLESFR